MTRKVIYLVMALAVIVVAARFAFTQLKRPRPPKTEPLLRIMRFVGGEESAYFMKNSRYATQPELMRFLQENGPIHTYQPVDISSQALKPHELKIALLPDSLNYQATLTRLVNPLDSSTWCDTGVLLDYRRRLYTTLQVVCEAPGKPLPGLSTKIR